MEIAFSNLLSIVAALRVFVVFRWAPRYLKSLTTGIGAWRTCHVVFANHFAAGPFEAKL